MDAFLPTVIGAFLGVPVSAAQSRFGDLWARRALAHTVVEVMNDLHNPSRVEEYISVELPDGLTPKSPEWQEGLTNLLGDSEFYEGLATIWVDPSNGTTLNEINLALVKRVVRALVPDQELDE